MIGDVGEIEIKKSLFKYIKKGFAYRGDLLII